MRALTVPNEYWPGTCPNEIEVAGRASSTNLSDTHDVAGGAVCFRWLSRTVCWVCVWSTALAQQQGSWSQWKTRWVPFHCTGTTAGFMESMKDKVSSVPLYRHNSRLCGVNERQGEFHSICTSTTAGLVELMKDMVSSSPFQYNSRPWGVDKRWGEFHSIVPAQQQILRSWWKTRWVPFHCTSTTADLVELMKDKASSIPLYQHRSRPCGIHERWGERHRPCGVDERQGEFHFIVPAQQQTLLSSRFCGVHEWRGCV